MDDGRQKVTIILDPDVKSAVERQTAAERGSVSGICRRVLSDWVQSHQTLVQERAT